MFDVFNDNSQNMNIIDGSDFNVNYVELCWNETKSPEPEEIIRRIVEDAHNCYAYHLKKSVQHFPEDFMIRKKGIWGTPSDKARIVTNTGVCKYFEHSFYKVYYDLINGANVNYGGFSAYGSIRRTVDGRYYVVVNYSFHDMIDEKTKDDNLFAGMARLFLGTSALIMSLRLLVRLNTNTILNRPESHI